MTTRTRKQYRRACATATMAGFTMGMGKGLTHAEALDLLYAVSEGVLEFIEAYPSPEGKRLSTALRAANRIVRQTHRITYC
jgi:hypothetical protein